MSVAILLAEATLLPSIDLSLFSILIKSVQIQELLVQAFAFVPLIDFFDKVFDFLGSWKRYIFKTEAEDMDGLDPSGVIILQKERSWLEQGRKIGEEKVVPLARNFNGIDIESGQLD
ncbi:hypothetical protein RYX36_018792 [Vicia faba]